MAYRLLTNLPPQFEGANGNPLVGGTLEFYIWNTTTPTPLYTDSTGTALGTSCALNSLGQPQTSGGTACQLFGDTGLTAGYKIVRKDAAGSVIPPNIGPVFPIAAALTDFGGGSAADIDYTTPAGTTFDLETFLDNRYVVYAKDFGVVGDGVADDTVALQAALNYADTNKRPFRSVGCPTINITSTITIPSTMDADFSGSRIEPNASMTTGRSVVIDGNTLGFIFNPAGCIKNLWVRRAYVANHPDTASNLDGVAITGDSGQASFIDFYSLRVEGFRDNLIIGGVGATAFILSFYNIQIHQAWRRGLTFVNSVENVNFHGGCVGNCNNQSFNAVGIHSTGAGSLDFSMYGLSVDYCDISMSLAVGIVLLDGCHFENNTNNPHVILTKTGGRIGCSLTMVGGQMTGGPHSVGWTGLPAESANGRPSWISTVLGAHSVSIQNTYMGKFRTVETVTEVVKNTDGIANRKLDLKPFIESSYTGSFGSPESISLSTNKLYRGASGSLTGWVNGGGGGVTWSADTVEMYSPDTGSRKVVSGGAGSSFAQTVQLGDASALIFKAWVKVPAAVAIGYVAVEIVFFAPDGVTQIGVTIISAQNITAASADWIPQFGMVPIPAGAHTVVFRNRIAAFNGTAHFSNEHLWLI